MGDLMQKNVAVSAIQIDNATHPRDAISEDTVAEYAEAMKAGAVFPPIVVFLDGHHYHLADGRHRLEACLKSGIKTVRTEIRKGSSRDAILYAVGANNEHGLRRSNADKRKAVAILLRDLEWRKWALNKIAGLCRVSWELAREVWNEQKAGLHLLDLEDRPERKVERGGKVFPQKTGARGRKAGRPDAMQTTTARTLGEVISLTAAAREGLQAENKPQLVRRLDTISGELQEILGQATGARCRLESGLRQPINVYERPRQDGVKPNPEFRKKRLCNYSVGVGMSCGHQCTYCSTPALLRTHEVYRNIQQTSFQRGFAIVDPDSAERIGKNIPAGLTATDVIQLSTIDDAWSPESRKYDLGRKVMEVLLKRTPAQIRVLTKSAEVARDFDLFRKYKDRVIVGLSTGIPPDREDVARVVEPNASPVRKRLDALKKAHDMGLRTYGMLCPCLPAVASEESSLSLLFDEVLSCGAEDIWLEPVNARGQALLNTALALRRAGLTAEADAVDAIRKRDKWSAYARALIETVMAVAAKKKATDKLHVLLYPTSLTATDRTALRKHKQGIIWLDKTTTESE